MDGYSTSICTNHVQGTTIAAFEAEGRQFHHYDDPNCVDLAEFEKFCRKCKQSFLFVILVITGYQAMSRSLRVRITVIFATDAF